MNRVKSTAAGLILGLAVALANTAAATAHETLRDSSPRPGETLESGPSEIVLTFSGQLIDGGAAIAVLDADSRDWVAGAPAADETTVRVELEPALPDGEYEVLWRVVSSDGHPLSGAFTFQVGDVGPDDHASSAADPDPPGSPTERSTATPWVILLAVAAVTAAAGYLWRRVASSGRSSATSGSSASTVPPGGFLRFTRVRRALTRLASDPTELGIEGALRRQRASQEICARRPPRRARAPGRPRARTAAAPFGRPLEHGEQLRPI